MEKGKKNVKSSKDGVESPAKAEKAKTKAKNVIKPRDANTSIGEMVTATLQALNNDGGVSLMQIRNLMHLKPISRELRRYLYSRRRGRSSRSRSKSPRNRQRDRSPRERRRSRSRDRERRDRSENRKGRY